MVRAGTQARSSISSSRFRTQVADFRLSRCPSCSRNLPKLWVNPMNKLQMNYALMLNLTLSLLEHTCDTAVVASDSLSRANLLNFTEVRSVFLLKLVSAVPLDSI